MTVCTRTPTGFCALVVGKLNTKFVHKIPLGRILTLTLTPTLTQNDSLKPNGHYNIALNVMVTTI